MKLFLVVAVCLTLVAVSESAAIGIANQADLDRLSYALRVLEALAEKNTAVTTAQPTTTATTTQAPPKPTTAQPQSRPQSAFNQFNSQHLCAIAMDLYPPVKGPQTKKDFVVNLINYICLPSVSPDDLYAAAVLLQLMGETSGYEESNPQYLQIEGGVEDAQDTEQGLVQAFEEALTETAEEVSADEGGEEVEGDNGQTQQGDNTPTEQAEEDSPVTEAAKVVESTPQENVEDTNADENDENGDDDDDDDDKEEEGEEEQDTNIRRAEEELADLLRRLVDKKGL